MYEDGDAGAGEAGAEEEADVVAADDDGWEV